MQHFPVSHSTLSPHHLAVFLKKAYALGNDTHCQLIKAGINHTYLVSGAGKHVFRVYSLNWRSRKEIDEEISLLNKLKAAGIPVSFPIADKNGNYVQSLNAPEGERYGVMFSYAAGEKQHRHSPETHYHIGAILARMHQVTENMQVNRLTYTAEVLLKDSLNKLRKFLAGDTVEMQFMVSTGDRLLKELSAINGIGLRSGVVHLDYWFDNINVTAANEITFFDFDFCGNGWLCLDIAYYIMQLYNIGKYDSKEFLPTVQNFLKGYESVTPISAEEKRLIPLMGVSLYFFYLGVQCQRYDNWSNSFLTTDYLKRFINGLVKRYFELTVLNDPVR
jgi:Ser/Thr protein kinase RdoA (MazF antagonist)